MCFALEVYSLAFQPLAEALLRADLLAGPGRPLRPGAKQCSRFFPRVRITLAAFFNPSRNSVLGFQILCRCLRNGFWGGGGPVFSITRAVCYPILKNQGCG